MSWVATAVVVAVAGAAAGGYAAYSQTRAANAAAEYNAKVQERNAQIAEMQAKDAEARGKLDEKKQRQKIAATISAQRNAAAASGITIDSGSVQDNIMDTAKYGELDALTVRRNAAMEAWGYRNQGANYSADAQLSQMSKRNAATAGTTTFLGSLGASAGTLTALSGPKSTPTKTT
jgi:hypothetical protein